MTTMTKRLVMITMAIRRVFPWKNTYFRIQLNIKVQSLDFHHIDLSEKELQLEDLDSNARCSGTQSIYQPQSSDSKVI